MSIADERAFKNLLAQLQLKSPTIPAETLYTAISYFLSNTPQHFTSRQLTAAIISSPIWDPLSLSSLACATSAFRRAIRAKHDALETRPISIFLSKRSDFNAWLVGILKGLDNGNTLLRLAISGGLLLEMTEYIPNAHHQKKALIEEEVIASLAEILDSADNSDAKVAWEKTFNSLNKSYDGPYPF